MRRRLYDDGARRREGHSPHVGERQSTTTKTNGAAGSSGAVRVRPPITSSHARMQFIAAPSPTAGRLVALPSVRVSNSAPSCVPADAAAAAWTSAVLPASCVRGPLPPTGPDAAARRVRPAGRSGTVSPSPRSMAVRRCCLYLRGFVALFNRSTRTVRHREQTTRKVNTGAEAHAAC